MARRRASKSGGSAARVVGAPASATLALVLVLVLSACGGGSGTSSASTGGTAATTAVEPGPGAFVSLGNVPKLGLVLVDAHGFTLYAFDKDRDGRSHCYGVCMRTFLPALTKGAPQPSNGTSAADLGTTTRRDGEVQVTYAGRPLYSFAEDRGPGEARGNDFLSYGGRWHALKGNGEDAGG
jgi:predicted lipoprotein with Yx(FWY)xxD motif